MNKKLLFRALRETRHVMGSIVLGLLGTAVAIWWVLVREVTQNNLWSIGLIWTIFFITFVISFGVAKIQADDPALAFDKAEEN